MYFKMSSAISFNLNQSKMFSSGNGVNTSLPKSNTFTDYGRVQYFFNTFCKELYTYKKNYNIAKKLYFLVKISRM